ncbi:MAG: cytochrome c oxidase subunit 3 [Acidobacteria bacterium]|nr:cytochrome c oxidase subunit 3 [Acidobacteriota bacterium]MBI3656121.1 cytochrome c oxidase subunit 3 [Acidobacteriota bacterium]
MAALIQRKPTEPYEDTNGRARGGSNDGGRRELSDPPIPSAQLGLWLFMMAVTMLFAGFASAYIISRRGQAWLDIPRPTVLWYSTSLLLLSSGTLEMARRALRRSQLPALKGWLSLTTLFGLSFIIGQLEAWRQLRAAGLYLPTNQHSSFFYLLTGMHGLHFLGGIAVLLYALFQAAPATAGQALRGRINLCAVYWHFLTGLWLYLFWLFLSR